jgi:adenylosuccinate lyase
LRLAIGCIDGLEVDVDRMRANIDASHGLQASERVLGMLSPTLGKHRAQATLQTVLGAARRDGQSLAEALDAAGLMTRADAEDATADLLAPGDVAAVRCVVGRVEDLRR